MFVFITGGVFVRCLNKSQESAFSGALDSPHGGWMVRGGGVVNQRAKRGRGGGEERVRERFVELPGVG